MQNAHVSPHPPRAPPTKRRKDTGPFLFDPLLAAPLYVIVRPPPEALGREARGLPREICTAMSWGGMGRGALDGRLGTHRRIR